MPRSPKLDASPGPLITRFTVALAIAIAVVLSAFPPTAQAQAQDLIISADTIYRVDVANEQILVESTYSFRNNVPPVDLGDGRTRRRYFNEFGVAIPQSATDYNATMDGQRVQAGFQADENFVYAESPFLNRLYYGDEATLSVSYVIPNSGPRGGFGSAHITDDLVSFRVWTQGDPGRANVRIVLPAGYEIDLGNRISQLTANTSNGQTTLAAYGIGDPLNFNGEILARNEYSQLENTSLAIHSGTAVVLSRPSDTVWRDFVVDALQTDLPVLEELIGIPWPHNNLVVEQSTDPQFDGFGGWYRSSSNTIEVGEELNRETLLHEFTHGWFNHRFSEERWILEGLAEEFASRAFEATGDARPDPNWPDPNAGEAMPLMEWERIDSVTTSAQGAVERYHYNASWWLFRQITDEIGMDAFSEVLVAFQSEPPPNRGSDIVFLFELLDEHTNGDNLDDLFETYVLSPGVVDLQQRRSLIDRTDALFADMSFDAPPILQDSMSDWNFDHAETQLAQIEALLPQMHELQARADELSTIVELRWSQLEIADKPVSLPQLADTIADDLATLERVAADRETLRAEAAVQNMAVDFGSVSILNVESELDEMRQVLETVTERRSEIAATAEEYGLAINFRPDADLPAAEQELAALEVRLDQFLVHRRVLDDRATQLQLSAVEAPAPHHLAAASHALKRQASIVDALVNEGVSVDKLASTGLSSQVTKDQALPVLEAHRATNRTAALWATRGYEGDSGSNRLPILGSAIAVILLAILFAGLAFRRS